jgi:predicted RNase H-like HicB family nuclease
MKVRDVIKLIEQDGWFFSPYGGKSLALPAFKQTRHSHSAGPSRERYAGRHQKQRIEAGEVEMSEALRYAVVFERSEDGYGAYVPDLPGCVTVGDTLAEIEANIREAIAGHIAVMKEYGDSVPQPSSLAAYVEVPIAVGQ